MGKVVHVVSVSGGKDSLATLLLALNRCPRGSVAPIFCDTDNEDQQVYEYLDYIEQALGLTIKRLRGDFAEQIAAQREFIARDVRTGRTYERVPRTDAQGNIVYRRDAAGLPELQLVFDRQGRPDVVGVPKMRKASGRKVRWSNKTKRRALAALHATGNAFLDLCLWKGRFPSRKAQFCTEELKRNMAVAFQLDLIEAGHRVVSWQGVRRDESLNRHHAKKTERVGRGLQIMRPIVDWTAAQVFDYCAEAGLRPNPLYLQGQSRVGCMPCINCGKDDLRAIATRWPSHITRIAEWEALVSKASKRGGSTFMSDAHKAKDRRVVFADLNIHSRVQWAKTTRGGRQYDLLATAEDSAGCSSSYGLCDQGAL